jgi:hypothetical protein
MPTDVSADVRESGVDDGSAADASAADGSADVRGGRWVANKVRPDFPED